MDRPSQSWVAATLRPPRGVVFTVPLALNEPALHDFAIMTERVLRACETARLAR